jgi:CheY-like chemotaxis protein
MKKRVLDVGNCPPDHAAIRQLIESHFTAVVLQAHHADDALSVLRQDRIDLVLVNRKLDRDYSDGLLVIRQIKADPELADTPVMMITNYDDHQQMAIQAGAIPGFGKLALRDATTLERLRAVLT